MKNKIKSLSKKVLVIVCIVLICILVWNLFHPSNINLVKRYDIQDIISVSVSKNITDITNSDNSKLVNIDITPEQQEMVLSCIFQPRYHLEGKFTGEQPQNNILNVIIVFV